MKTWQGELAFAALTLGAIVAVTGGGWRECLTAVAVLAGFAHAQVSDRLAEMEGRRTQPEVHCWRWTLRYFVAKEALWFAVFAAYRNWSALAGVVLFLLYPAWRKWYRRMQPTLVEP